jgi:PEP-CTERM motif
MKRFVVAVVALAFCCIPARAGEISIGPSIQDVILQSVGNGTQIAVTFGSCVGTTCTLSNSGGTAYTLTTSFATKFLDFTYTGTAENFKPAANSFTANVGGSGNKPASYTLAFSDGSVEFDGTWNSGQTFDYTLNSLTCVTGTCPPATSSILTSLAGDSSSTEWEATISSGEFVTPEPAALALLGTALFGAYGLLRRKLKEV